MCVRAGMRFRFDDPKLIIVFPPGEAHTITFTVKDSLPACTYAGLLSSPILPSATKERSIFRVTARRFYVCNVSKEKQTPYNPRAYGVCFSFSLHYSYSFRSERNKVLNAEGPLLCAVLTK